MSIEKTNVNITENGVVNEQDNVQVGADNAQIDTQEVIKELPKITLEEFKEKVTIKKYIPFSSKKSIGATNSTSVSKYTPPYCCTTDNRT